MRVVLDAAEVTPLTHVAHVIKTLAFGNYRALRDLYLVARAY